MAEPAQVAEEGLVADDAGVHDIGGIMGGEHSGVTEATTDILIECAWFDPGHITLTGRARLHFGRAPPFRARRRPRLSRPRPGDRHRRLRWRSPAARPRKRFAPGTAAVRTGSSLTVRPGQELGGIAVARRGRRTSSRASAWPCNGRRLAVRGAELAARVEAPARHGRRGRRIEGLDMVASPRCRARRVSPGQPQRPSRWSSARVRRRPRRRAERGGDLELHCRSARPNRSAARPGGSTIRSARR